MKITDIVSISPVIPVLAIENLEHAVPLAKALHAGGMRVLEITLRTSCAIEAIAAIKHHVPEAILGAGTVVDGRQIEACLSAGCDFLVSPGTTDALLIEAQQRKINFLPGVSTLSEALRARSYGFCVLKFFPAMALGGIATLQAWQGPMPALKFCPTGGVGEDNFGAFLALANVVCVGGSWMAPQKLIARQDWPAISALAKATMEKARNHGALPA